jgi:acyl carrier protein
MKPAAECANTETLSEESVLFEVASIWCAVLGHEEIGPEDNFFQLGGDSVMVMSVLLRVEESFGIYLDPGEVFDAPTLGQFASRVSVSLGGVSSGRNDVAVL